MPDEHEPKSPIEILGDKLGDATGEILPEQLRTPGVGYALGSVVGFIAGWFFGRAIVKSIFSSKGDEK